MLFFHASLVLLRCARACSALPGQHHPTTVAVAAADPAPSGTAGTYTGYPATVTLSGPVSCSSSAQAYASMVISAPGSGNPAQSYCSGLVP